MKKFLSLFLSCVMCCTAMALTGCSDDNGDSSSSSTSVGAPVEEYLELRSSNEILTLGDKIELTASYNEIDGETLTFSSSDPSVVSVDNHGFVEALKVGTATVTARYGTKQATCEVEVGLSGNVPTLAFDNNMRDEITLMKSSAYDFGAHVRFNGKTFTDAEIEYYVADESIATVVDGKLETKQKAGSTQVSVVATWRGQTVHTKTVKVNVVAETTVLLNGGTLTAVDVYTVENHEDKTYSTSQTISSVFVSYDGAEVQDYELSIMDEGIATIEKVGSEWKIQSVKAGKTNLIVSFADKEVAFDVQVLRPVHETDITVDYSLAETQYFDEASQTMKPVTELIEGFADIVSYEFDGKESKLKNGVLSLPTDENCTVNLYGETVGYQVTVRAYTMILDELKDFEKIYAGQTAKDIEGSFILVKDIIEPTSVLSMPAGMVPNHFAGTFDGRGHVLSFTLEHTHPHKFGLFGQCLKGATIKNLALSNVTQDGTAGSNPAGIICYEGSDGQDSAPISTLENIYVDVQFSKAGESNLVFMHNAMWKIDIKNVIIHAPIVPEADTYGSFARGEVFATTDSYVISTAPLYVTVKETNFKKVPVLYASYEEMKSAGNDYSSFSTKYWDTTNGYPVWKSLMEVEE